MISYDIIWHGMAWRGMVWFGMVWYGMVTFCHLVNLEQLACFNSFSYLSAKLWNALPDFIRTSAYTDFRRKIQGCIFV